MEDHASSLESYKKLFGDEDTNGSHNNKIDIGNEEIGETKREGAAACGEEFF